MDDLAQEIIDSIDKPCEISFQETNDHRSYFASFEKIENILGFRTNYSVKDGAQEIYQALQDNIVTDNIKTKTVEWYKHLLNNPEDSKKFLINDTLF